MSTLHPLSEANLRGTRVLLRAGFDMPMEEGRITDTSRIEAILPTMQAVLGGGASLVLLAHQGRPKGTVQEKFSQKPLVPVLAKLLGTSVHFADSCIGQEAQNAAKKLKAGEVLLLENLRFDPREEANDESFARELAGFGDLYVNDAFSNSHRAHASMSALATLLPSYMGLQLEREVRHLSKIIEDPRRPLTLIVSGAKIETKLPVIRHFLEKGDDILLGGAIANTFLAARGFDVAKSKVEEQFFEQARTLMLESERTETANILVPRDGIVASEPSAQADLLDLPVEDIEGDMAIFDIGRVTRERYREKIRASGSIVWNGPMGLYEHSPFSHGTRVIADAIREATEGGALSVIGGGDTIDAHARYDMPLDGYTFVSTGGGAMLEFIAGEKLPAIQALMR